MNYFLFCVILLILFFTFGVFEKFSYESQCDTNELPQVIQKILKERKWNRDKINWNYFFPCEYTKCEENIKELKSNGNGKKIFMIDGCDQINSKVKLWTALLETFGRKQAQQLMPNTFFLDEEKDMNKFENHYKIKMEKNKYAKFIMKNHKQRQEGLKLTNNLNEIKRGYDDGYYIVQDYLENPFLVSGRKVNFRRYMLVVCRNKTIEGYIHDDGFVYYTPELYDATSLDPKQHITTGYIDRQVYRDNFLTVKDFKNHLSTIDNKYPTIFDKNVNTLFKNVFTALQPRICQNERFKDSTLFQLFGADISLDNDMNVMLMEINKGPDIGAKDDRDKEIKTQVIRDIISIVENEKCDNFLRVY